MFPTVQARTSPRGRAGPSWLAMLATLSGLLLSACGGNSVSDVLATFSTSPQPPAQPASAIGGGRIKVGLILPLSGAGNAGVAAQSMRNAAEMALAEYNNPDLQLLLKDDGGSASGAQQAAQQAGRVAIDLVELAVLHPG